MNCFTNICSIHGLALYSVVFTLIWRHEVPPHRGCALPAKLRKLYIFCHHSQGSCSNFMLCTALVARAFCRHMILVTLPGCRPDSSTIVAIHYRSSVKYIIKGNQYNIILMCVCVCVCVTEVGCSWGGTRLVTHNFHTSITSNPGSSS